MDRFRIEDIQDVTLNGQDCRLFKVFELNQAKDAYVFAGQHTAPTGTREKDLHRYVGEGVHDEKI